MRPSTEKLLRQKLAMDMAEYNFVVGIAKFLAAFGIVVLLVVYVLEPLTAGRPLFQPAPQAQPHQHKGVS